MSDPNLSTGKFIKETLLDKWRPVLGWTYIIICMHDFVLGPLTNALLSTIMKVPPTAWKPLTMAEGGMFHVAIGAILGAAAWTRGQEKIARINSQRDPYLGNQSSTGSSAIDNRMNRFR